MSEDSVKAAVVDKNGQPVTACPFCGYEEFFVSAKMSGWGQYFIRFDSHAGDNTTLHDGLHYRLGSVAKCGNCNKRVGRFNL